MLGLDPVPWGERLSGGSAAPAATPASGVEPPRPLQDYEETFRHPAYGDLVLQVADGALVAAFHGLDDELDPLVFPRA